MGVCASADARPVVPFVSDSDIAGRSRSTAEAALQASRATPPLRLPAKHRRASATDAVTTVRSPRAITRAVLREHADNLWIAVHGRVYDVTGFLPDHPGGPHVLREYAGTDATRAFDGAHAGEASRLGRWRGLKAIGRLAD